MTRYGKTDHSPFFMKIVFWVWINAEFTVDFNGQRTRLQKAPKLSYAQEIVHGSPMPQSTIFEKLSVLHVHCSTLNVPYMLRITPRGLFTMMNLPGKMAIERWYTRLGL